MLEQFEKPWLEGFYNTISSKVKTMATTTKSIKIGDSKIYDLNVIYLRTIALVSSDRDVDVKDVLAYELAPVPTAMFTEDGMRICKAKSTLKKSLQRLTMAWEKALSSKSRKLGTNYQPLATWMHHSSKSSTKPLPSSQPVMT
ncbi:hypothetical protein JOQ06_021285 [Pogonophryne albipinna]|uniref:Uncharacterized protein n=1 Tax=Pogonophryne albipinna TaxID=1090488 RepID=A0AAD6F6Y7_9TELE|nr:hypothetical protein JOQ06_021285 [Pogonophryne albipinna]